MDGTKKESLLPNAPQEAGLTMGLGGRGVGGQGRAGVVFSSLMEGHRWRV